jgi:hypothetical protein
MIAGTPRAAERTDYWFRPKRYGYGATPLNWKGWAAVAVFVVLIVAITLLLVPKWNGAPSVLQFAAWAAVVAVLTAGFVAFCRTKTDGQWSWRWGK